MKKLFGIGFGTVIAIMIFTAVTYTSCTKDKCKDVTCQNGGTCTDGVCSCPSGFEGTNCETASTVISDSTTIGYQNKTFTPVHITFNGISQTIPAGGMGYFTAMHGTSASGSATTTGTNSLGDPVGVNYSWGTLNAQFPARDTLILPLSTPGSLFFVRVINKSSEVIIKCRGNYGVTGQLDDVVSIPNDSASHDVGYYYFYNNSNVRVESLHHYWLDDTLGISGTKNQVATFEIH